MNAVLLITAKAELPDLTSAKRVKAQYLVTLALQSYKGEVVGTAEWGPARITAEMKTFFGVTIDPKNWTRDWLDLWESLKEVIKEVDIQAQQPVWQVIHSEKDEEAARDGVCAYFSHSAQVTRNAHETLNPAIETGFHCPPFVHCPALIMCYRLIFLSMDIPCL
ncbi:MULTISPECIES: hypothetical protein [Pseudomonas]|uniref:hypothetical protein n=1 Tax=Pseudomonas TaxID=286 RepID=UPI001FD578FA|nr:MULTISPECIES: hypothetical protein [Pseudomonas]WLG53700.1 hypothetical protein PSH64_14710 [Pseudomonas sp. FP1742]